ncbi:HEXXH motif domain-containing protein [Paractinoplanes maris]|uniref:HEXXH motif domain-containing protein n=1 Tax=Paractinoplanes maris TaxID=1734446 RepID=UPI00201FDA7C|nr:HEXXH motif domain-containing protein [Actinoplanes maris]
MSTVQGAGHNPPAFTVPVGILDSIARGGGGSALTELSRAQHSKAVLLVRAIAELGSRPGPSWAADVADSYQALLAVADQAPGAVREVLVHPSVLGWAMSTTVRLHGGLPAEPGVLAQIGAAAALRGRAAFAFTGRSAPVDPGGLALPSLGYLRQPPAGDGLDLRIEAGGGGMWLNGVPVARDREGLPTGPGWRPLPRLQVDARWPVQVDGVASPLPGPEPLLDAAQAARWRDGLAGGWRILAADHPGTAADVAAVVRTVLPLPSPPEGHASGTYRHAFGCIGMSVPREPTLTALSLTHELHHLKLSGLTDLFELIETSAVLGYAPWRDDPRPAIGLLHGAYAHLGVAAFWRRRVGAEPGAVARHDAGVEYVRWREAALTVSDDLLATAPLTALGRRFVTGMRAELAGWRADPIPRSVTAEAARLNDEHRALYGPAA